MSCCGATGGMDLARAFRDAVLKEDLWQNNARAMLACQNKQPLLVPVLDGVILATNPAWLEYGYVVDDDAFQGGSYVKPGGRMVRVDTCPGEGTSRGRGSLGQGVGGSRLRGRQGRS